MIQQDKFHTAVFNRYQEKILGISEHLDGCQYAERQAPVSECMCHCYEKQIFDMGRDAEERLFYEAPLPGNPKYKE